MTFLQNLAVIVSQRRAIGGVPAIISVMLLLLDVGTPSACLIVLLIGLLRVLRFLSAHMGAAYRTFGIKTGSKSLISVYGLNPHLCPTSLSIVWK